MSTRLEPPIEGDRRDDSRETGADTSANTPATSEPATSEPATSESATSESATSGSATNEPAGTPSQSQSEAEPAATRGNEAIGDPKREVPSATRERLRLPRMLWRKRWVRRLTFATGVVLTLTLTLVLLVRWSIRDHDARMLNPVDTSRLDKRVLFESGTHGYQQYRAPALVISPRGTLLAFAEGRHDDHDAGNNMVVLMRTSDDSGSTWSEPRVIAQERGASIGSPTPLTDSEKNRVWLVYRRIKRTRTGWQRDVLAMHSADDGQTWSKPRNIVANAQRPPEMSPRELAFPSPGHGIQLQKGSHAGRLLVPTYSVEDSEANLRARARGHAQVLYSDDYGDSWRFGGRTDYGGENMLAELASGEVLMVIRTRAYAESPRKKLFTRSRDGGLTWSPTELSEDLVEPVCQSTLLQHPNGGPSGGPALYYIAPSGQASGRWDKGARRDIKVWISTDEGRTWPISRLLHPGGASYTDGGVDEQGSLHVVIEVGKPGKAWGGAVTYAKFGPSWVDDSLGTESDMPFSELVYETYRRIRGPLEERWKDGP